MKVIANIHTTGMPKRTSQPPMQLVKAVNPQTTFSMNAASGELFPSWCLLAVRSETAMQRVDRLRAY